MSQTPNHLILKAIRQEPVTRTPVWIMRQAGRYLPEYIKLKNEAGGFMNLVKNPDLACEITMQPLRRYSLDSAIVFSDILIVAEVIGIDLDFIEKKGPVFDKTIRTDKDFEILNKSYDINNLDYVFHTIKKLKNELNGKKPLIGFIGSPWTVATYLIEGNSSKEFTNVQKLLKTNKPLLHNILNLLTDISIDYLNKQIESGIDISMIFDTWGSLLNNESYEELSLRYINKIKHSISKTGIPLIYYVRNTESKINQIKNLDIDVLGIDATAKIGDIKRAVGNRFALQGNLDIEVLRSDEKAMIKSVNDLLKDYNCPVGHIFNLGSGITPDIDPGKVKLLIDIIRDISPSYNVK